jgi:hypothetical protein
VFAGGLLLLFVLTIAAMAYVSSRRPEPGPSPSPGAPDPGTGDSGRGGQGQVIDGIQCETHEQVSYHVHAHLAILVNGQPQLVSAQVGIPGGPNFSRCYYWLHTHDTSGVIHIESPDQRGYTLGQFFDIWGQPLSGTTVAVYPVPSGQLTAYVDGQPWNGSPRDIPLKAHTQVVLELGQQITPPPGYNFPSGL